MSDFELNLLRGAALVLLIIAFLSMWVWAWSDKRKADFRKMSHLPLEEDQGMVPNSNGEVNGRPDGAEE